MQGIIYTRVSSDEQVKGMSLDFQKEDCFRYAKEKNITLVKTFVEKGESAKFANRPELVNLLEYARNNKGKIDVLIVWKLDRLSRNQMDYYFIKRTLLGYGISLVSATEPSLDGDSIAGKVFETFTSLQAEIDNTVRRERAIRGMEAKIMSGIHPWKPPLGYQSAQNRLKGLKKTEPDEPDNQRFPIIQQLFRACLKERICGSVELCRLANKWGLTTETGRKMYPQLIERILSNKFYAGILVNQWGGHQEVEGKHQRMLSPDEFYQVQFLRKGKSRQQPDRRRVDHPDFPLRRTVLCGMCSVPMTGSSPRGNGGRYPYYHCRNSQCEVHGKAIPKLELEELFVKELASITPKANMLDLFRATILDAWKEKEKILEDITRRNKQKRRELEDQLENLIKMRMKNLLTDEEFLPRKERLNNEIAAARVTVSESELAEFDIENVLNYATSFMTNLPRQWFDMSPEYKRRFQVIVFPEGIPFIRGKGFGTAKLGLLYEVFEQSHGSKTRLVHLVCVSWNQIMQFFGEIMEFSEESALVFGDSIVTQITNSI